MSCFIKRVLQFNTAVAFGPVVVADADDNDVTDKCLFSWSADGVCWTAWAPYSSYLQSGANVEGEMFLRLLIVTTIGHVELNHLITECYTVCLYDENPFLQDFCGVTALFNPYAGLDCALLLQQQLADSIVCMLGIPIYYFRVKPDADTADYTFKEYVMHNVESVKQLKLMIADGQMPSSRPQFTELDFDWETDWETELSKSQFAAAFGDTAFPKQRDFVYVPMMKRMWEVNSAYDEKNEGLMWQSTTWKLGLIKWNEKTNVSTEDFDDMIDTLIVNTQDSVFKPLTDAEQEKMTGTTQAQMPVHAANGLTPVFMSDAIRHSMTADKISITPMQLNQGSSKIVQDVYTFSPGASIIYQKGYCGESGVLSFIIKTGGVRSEMKTVLSAGHVSVSCDGEKVSFNGLEADISSGVPHMVICSWDRKTFVTQLVAYPYVIPDGVPPYKLRPEMCRFDFSAQPVIGTYNNDFRRNTCDMAPLVLTADMWQMTNIKLFNTFMSTEEAVKECCKYTTKSGLCIINDLARELNTGLGFPVK